MRLLLASGSPRRLDICRDAGFVPVVRAPDIDESYVSGEPATEYAERVAREKLGAALERYADLDLPALALAADTVVWADRHSPLGKPVDADDARRMLRQLSGGVHSVSTGWAAFMRGSGQPMISATVTTRVTFTELGAGEIDAYIASGEPFGKAGAYAIQGLGATFATRVDGCWMNVVGLPIASVLATLRTEGWLETLPWAGAATSPSTNDRSS